MNPDGSNPTRLTTDAAWDYEPAWSPDGQKIVYASNRDGNPEIYIMNADGSSPVQLTNMSDGACLPAWSPDGKLLAFISPCAGKRELYEGAKIYLLSPGTNEEPQPLPLPASPAGDFYPAWSPDGRQIAFTSLRGTRAQILVYDLETQSMRQLTDGRYADIQPVFSPDGSQIAFIRKFTYTEIWVMGRKGENAHRFNPAAEINHYYPVWTPDSQFILVSQSKDGDYIPWLTGFRVENGLGTSPIRIPGRGLPEIGPVSGVSISPDGAWIVYESWPDGTNHDIYRITINGANRQRLTEDKAEDFSPAWRPGS
jgi:Tol biopolymer transport system component